MASAFFGFSFLGIVTNLVLWAYRESLEPEASQSVPRYTRVGILTGTIAAMLIASLLGANSVFATTVGLALGAIAIGCSRTDLIRLIWHGALSSVGMLALLVSIFVFGIANNGDDLGRVISSFYVTRGAWETTFILFLWSAAFGAFFGPFIPWAKNLRLAV